jgi:Na+/melibiose symporter-like transporter
VAVGTPLINVPVGVIVVLLTRAFVPESKDPTAAGDFDVLGVLLGAIGLAGITYGLIAAGDHGLVAAIAWIPAVMGALLFSLFVHHERRARTPVLPVGLFRSRLFSILNVITFVVYAALGAIIMWLVLALQIIAGFRPVSAGLALLPLTVLMLLLSARMGALAHRIGPRLPMTVGLLVAASGCFHLAFIGQGAGYVTSVLPGVVLLGVGLACTVAPLTTTALAAAPESHAGIASGINNAVARVASLLAIAALPLVTGLRGEAYHEVLRLAPAYCESMWICAGALALGSFLTLAFVRTGARSPIEASDA